MMIHTTQDLNQLCAELAKSPFVAIDTEFIREKTYYPELCLIQIAGPEKAACIDPLAPDLDLTALFDLLQNPKVIKVFHAAHQDVEIFYHLAHRMPTPLFDTQIAAMVCGYDGNVGYQQLVADITGVSLDKSMRVTDWKRRPLSEEQVKYALYDVTYLRDVYRALMKKLAENGREAWLAEEIAILNNPETYEVNDDEVWKKFKLPFKRPIQTHVFARLCAWRERTAKQKDRPKKFILKDDALLELAIMMPKTAEEMDACRNISVGFGKSVIGQEILAVIHQALSDPAEQYPREWAKPKALSPAQHTMADMLHQLLMIVSTTYGVAPKIIAPAEELNRLARGDDNVPCMKGWRREVFGEKVILLKQGLLLLGYNPKTHRPELIERARICEKEKKDE